MDKVMKANELMEGIYVYFNCFDGSKIIVKVTGFKDGIVYGVSKTGSHWCTIEKVEPIPITPEILEKIGFKREGGASYWHEGNHDACILHWNKDKVQLIVGYPSDDYMVKMNVKHVHKLQHAFRLCGIEKEFEL